jgi:seryl-tRNA synthetase
VVEQAAERYARDDQARAEARIERWRRERAATRVDARLATLRQRRKRLSKLIQPRRPATLLDPWDIAAAAIAEARRLQKRYAASRPELDDIVEAIRRLAWGLGDDEPVPAHRRRRVHVMDGQLSLWDELAEVVAA